MPEKPTRGVGREAAHASAGARPKWRLALSRWLAAVCKILWRFIRWLLSFLVPLFPRLALLEPLPPGGVTPELKFSAATVQRMFTDAATEGGRQSLLVWVKDGNELLVNTGGVRVDLDDGLIIVNIPVSSDQTGDALIQAPFAVGSSQRPAGMLVATEERPRGPAQVVEFWGESLTAFAWRILLGVTVRIASDRGIDQDRAGLIPAALTASRSGLGLVAMARHTFDRVIK